MKTLATNTSGNLNDHSECDRTVVSIPPDRALVLDGGILGSRRHIIHGLVEVDVTNARDIRLKQDNKVSFTAYLVACLARAVAKHPHVQAYNFGNKNIVFHDVDVSTMIEAERDGVAVPHIIRNANQRSVRDMSDEIYKIKTNPEQSEQKSGKFVKMATKIPRWVRMIFYRLMKHNPNVLRDKMGTVMLTSVGMFGSGNGFGITYMPLHTLGLTIGGIQTKPGYVKDKDGNFDTSIVVPREYLNLTISFDHDVVDGAPAARFAKDLVAFIEDGRLIVDDAESVGGKVDVGEIAKEKAT